MRLIDRLFPVEEIRDISSIIGPDPLLLTRRHITPDWSKVHGMHWARWMGNVVVHRFYRPDKDRWMHDHARVIVSLCLRGWYQEVRRRPGPFAGLNSWTKIHRVGKLKYMRLGYAHKVTEVAHDGCTTLCWFGPHVRDWGFWVDGVWVPWREYDGGS